MQIESSLPTPVDVEAEIDKLARRYKAAGGLGINVLNLIGGSADNLIERLPEGIRRNLENATIAALNQAMKAAHSSRSVVPDQAGWLNQAVSTAMGAAGGAGGLPTAMAELPVTTTLLLRVIQGVAVEHGFDPEAESVQFDCVQVFAAAGPLSGDEGADLGFLSARLALSGRAMQAVIAKIAPKLAVVLGQKLAAQAVPVLGAVAGAATNYAYTSYYQDVAHVHFGLRKLAIDADIPHEDLLAQLAEKMAKPKVTA
ncbi:EcsC family protein [Sulfitobacter sp. M57]|uniref:EcsC family protein n=1 Tax=unclassified Sulfitobacter TaxID=196795 RepID=UPI0023E245EF|nr:MULTISPECIES: EcsC family protein [unclassified Sulfitobacter]MDF3413002.1 EcsC family protein [Sulfitobacter sp. KE5]MDF3421714.1 EcsC family protein [Sulfitobacter sp. KE43]MDF3431551.1 EcsC family protein [Sulfitobacter sp. KE42]MDF3457192.1 EcsC family protein [Sulfitobacter sp. S74]MDF3461095.1 EcsC family protein [Sulfitobacter sp. Ks18]